MRWHLSRLIRVIFTCSLWKERIVDNSVRWSWRWRLGLSISSHFTTTSTCQLKIFRKLNRLIVMIVFFQRFRTILIDYWKIDDLLQKKTRFSRKFIDASKWKGLFWTSKEKFEGRKIWRRFVLFLWIKKTLNYSLIASWTSDDVARWLKSIGFSKFVDKFTQKNSIDGLTLLLLTEEDLKEPPLSIDRLVDLKHLWYQIRLVQSQQNDFYSSLNISRTNFSTDDDRSFRRSEILDETAKTNNSSLSTSNLFESNGEQLFESSILEKRSRSVFKTTKGEKRKLLASFIYALISGIWTSFIMVVVHNRVPNVQK